MTISDEMVVRGCIALVWAQFNDAGLHPDELEDATPQNVWDDVNPDDGSHDHDTIRNHVRAALTAALQGSIVVPEWQDISTAPKDGTVVFIAAPSSNGTWFAADAKWDGSHWCLFHPDRDEHDEPTFSEILYWMPVPAFPRQEIGSPTTEHPPHDGTSPSNGEVKP